MATWHDDGSVDILRHDLQFVPIVYSEIIKHSGHNITLNINDDATGIAKMYCITCQTDIFEVEPEGTVTKYSKDHGITKRWREHVN